MQAIVETLKILTLKDPDHTSRFPEYLKNPFFVLRPIREEKSLNISPQHDST